jgi:hypothetical protein
MSNDDVLIWASCTHVGSLRAAGHFRAGDVDDRDFAGSCSRLGVRGNSLPGGTGGR